MPKHPFGIDPPAKRVWIQKGKSLPKYTNTSTDSGPSLWDPLTWFRAAVSTAGGIADDIVSWVTKAVRDVGNLVWEDLHNVWGLASGWSEDIVSYIEKIGKAAEGDLAGAFGDIYRFFHAAVHLAWSNFFDLLHLAEHIFNTTIKFARGILRDALAGAWHDLERYVFHPLDTIWKWFGGRLDWVWHQINKAWGEFYRDVIKPIENDVRAVVSRLDRIEHTLFHDVMVWIKALERAADWIIWFGEHSFKDIEELGKTAESLVVSDWLGLPKGERHK